jgi:hypothetical protein
VAQERAEVGRGDAREAQRLRVGRAVGLRARRGREREHVLEDGRVGEHAPRDGEERRLDL